MTLHSAKGLEFDTVFLPGWEEGLFPSQRTLDENGRAGLEEERRLAYVGITRARKRAYIRFASNRRMHGLWQTSIPSRFLDELPEAHVDVIEETSTYGGYGMNAYGASRFDTRDPFAEHLLDARLAARPEEPRRRRRSRPWAATATSPGRSPSQRCIEGELVAKSVDRRRLELRGRRARLPPEIRLRPHHRRSTATSSPSTSTRPGRSACSTASSSGIERCSTSSRDIKRRLEREGWVSSPCSPGA